MNCDKCGIENPDNANFCFDCGAKVSSAVKTTDAKKHGEATLYAFLAQAKSYGIPGFVGHTVIMTPRSPDDYIPKIRDEAGCPDSEVIILKPEEWDPPDFSTVSQDELTSKFPMVLTRVQNKMRELKLPYIGDQELIRNGTVMPNVASGKIFFIFKVQN